jgi:zinc transporter ZupT
VYAKMTLQDRQKWAEKRPTIALNNNKNNNNLVTGDDNDNNIIGNYNIDEHQAKQHRLQYRQKKKAPRSTTTPSTTPTIPILTVVFMTVAMAGAAGLGALPFFCMHSLSPTWTGRATAIACGVMLAASFDLVHEGQPYGAPLVILGIALGSAFISWSSHKLEAYENIEFAHLKGSRARKTFLMVAIMAAHALGEGCGVGVSFCGDRGWTQGVLTTLAIGVHNIPEGLAKATVLVGQGMSAWDAMLWSVVTCLPQPLLAVPSFMFVDMFSAILPIALGFAAGCMIWMVFAELIPDALEGASGGTVATGATLAAAALEGTRMLFESFETEDGQFAWGTEAAITDDSIGGVREGSRHFGIETSSESDADILTLIPAAVLAACIAGIFAGFPLRPPMALGLAASLTGFVGLSLLIDQAVNNAQVPLIHTAAAAVVGMTIVVLLRRQLLVSAVSAARRGKREMDENGQSKNHSNSGYYDLEATERGTDINNNNNSSSSSNNGGQYVMVEGPPSFANMLGSDDHGITSPSKSKGMSSSGGGMVIDANKWLQRMNNSAAAAAAKFKNPQKMAAPQFAACAVSLIALLSASAPLGLRLAQGSISSSTVGTVMIPAILSMGLYAAAAGTTLSAWLGRASASGVLLGIILGGATVASSAAGLIINGGNNAVPSSFDFPLGWATTLEAMSGGGLCLSSFFMLAVGMSLHPGRCRGAVVMGLVPAFGVVVLRKILCVLSITCLT